MTILLQPLAALVVDEITCVSKEREVMRHNLNTWSTAVVQFILDENGGEVLEYALIAGLIIVGAIAAVTSVGARVLARWNSLKNSI